MWLSNFLSIEAQNVTNRLRDQTDELAQVLTKNADSEEINKSSSECLQEFASTYTMIADNRYNLDTFLKASRI
jgi:FAM92 protein